jgi:hypothetical protein
LPKWAEEVVVSKVTFTDKLAYAAIMNFRGTLKLMLLFTVPVWFPLLLVGEVAGRVENATWMALQDSEFGRQLIDNHGNEKRDWVLHPPPRKRPRTVD